MKFGDCSKRWGKKKINFSILLIPVLSYCNAYFKISVVMYSTSSLVAGKKGGAVLKLIEDCRFKQSLAPH